MMTSNALMLLPIPVIPQEADHESSVKKTQNTEQQRGCHRSRSNNKQKQLERKLRAAEKVAFSRSM